jgi:hypothetical protein
MALRSEMLGEENLLNTKAYRQAAHKHLPLKLSVADAYTAAETKD